MLLSLPVSPTLREWKIETAAAVARRTDGSIDVDFLLKEKPRSLIKKLQGKRMFDNIDVQTFNTSGDPIGGVARLEKNYTEAQDLLDGNDVAAALRVPDCLSEDDRILATLPCLGFDGFPDFGVDSSEQYVVRRHDVVSTPP